MPIPRQKTVEAWSPSSRILAFEWQWVNRSSNAIRWRDGFDLIWTGV